MPESLLAVAAKKQREQVSDLPRRKKDTQHRISTEGGELRY